MDASLLFVVGLFTLAAVFIFEIITYSKLKSEYEMWSEVASSFIISFTEIKEIVNNNANSVKMVQEYTQKHEHMLKMMSMMMDIHSEVLKLEKYTSFEDITNIPVLNIGEN